MQTYSIVIGRGRKHGTRGLTDRQREVLTHIRAALERTGRPPTLRELGARLGIRSTNGVRDHLEALVAKGYLARDPHSARGLRLLHAPPPAVPGVRRVPLLGGVAAGSRSSPTRS